LALATRAKSSPLLRAPNARFNGLSIAAVNPDGSAIVLGQQATGFIDVNENTGAAIASDRRVMTPSETQSGFALAITNAQAGETFNVQVPNVPAGSQVIFTFTQRQADGSSRIVRATVPSNKANQYAVEVPQGVAFDGFGA
jgi:hypothetical protein